MIVRNESAVIRRCIDSVRDLIDTWVIVDTGSDDGTQGVIRAALEGLPGWLYERPWRDFGQNRTELLELARGTADYLLLLDADMTVSRHGQLPQLTSDAYLIGHEGELVYAVPRLIRGDLRWRYVGKTHEYLAPCGRPVDQSTLDALTIRHHADGGSRSDKLTRDLGLLERQLEETPDDPRTVFYLAQTVRDLGDLRRAEELYLRRKRLGGWDQEVFYAALQHAALVADRDWHLGREMLADAWCLRPWRIEPLYEIAVRARSRGEFAIADWASELGFGTPLPDDILFVHRWVYDWGIRLERSIACARRGRLDEAAALTDLLLRDAAVPEAVGDAARANRAWLDSQGAAKRPKVPRAGRVPTLAELGRAAAGIPLELEPGGGCDPGEGWEAMNPSVAHDGDGGLRVVVRAVNYRLSEGDYEVVQDSVVRSRNFLARLDESLSLREAVELADTAERPRFPSPVVGFEDLRLFKWQGSWWALATTRDSEASARAVQALLSVEGDRVRVEAVFGGPDSSRHEKNWMPFVVDDGLHFVYVCRPFTVLRFDPATGDTEVGAVVPTDHRFAGLRGGSQGLPVDDGFLFVTHQVLWHGSRRRYVHRFVSVDASLRPSGISRPFVFEQEGVEFCSGIAWLDAASGEDVVLSYGVDDGACRLAVIPLEQIVELMEPLSAGWE